MLIDAHALAAVCRLAAIRARRRGGPVLASYQVPLAEPADLIDLWDRFTARTDRCFCWSSAWSGRQIVAAGSMLDLAGYGPDRFTQVHRAWSALTGDPASNGPAAPAALGGFAFRPALPGERAAALPDALLWLPSLQVTRAGPGQPAWLALNAVIRPDTDPAAIVTELSATGRRLLRPGRGFLPHPREPRRELSVHEFPSSESWQRLVAKAVDEIRHGSFEKVVFARRAEVRSDGGFDTGAILRRFVAASGDTTVFASSMYGRCFLGATPEYLLQVAGDQMRTLGLAGSAPRGATPAEDAELERALRTSAKDTHEHAVVIRRLVTTLREHCSEVWTEPEPGVLKLPHVQHLCTRLGARLGEVSLLQLLASLHPTPALGGHPRGTALRWLADHEPLDRGWYAAPVGWLDTSGEGEFAVAIRSVLVSGGTASVYAGCGVVASSDPAAEYRESRVKMRGVLAALGAENNVDLGVVHAGTRHIGLDFS